VYSLRGSLAPAHVKYYSGNSATVKTKINEKCAMYASSLEFPTLEKGRKTQRKKSC